MQASFLNQFRNSCPSLAISIIVTEISMKLTTSRSPTHPPVSLKVSKVITTVTTCFQCFCNLIFVPSHVSCLFCFAFFPKKLLIESIIDIYKSTSSRNKENTWAKMKLNVTSHWIAKHTAPGRFIFRFYFKKKERYFAAA